MSWSYSGNPSATVLDEVRFLIGDTDTSDQQLSDEEINYSLTETTQEPIGAAIISAQALKSKFSRKADKTVGDLRISFSQLVDHYSELVESLRIRAALNSATPYAGGISIADKKLVVDDTDRVVPAFKVGIHDNV